MPEPLVVTEDETLTSVIHRLEALGMVEYRVLPRVTPRGNKPRTLARGAVGILAYDANTVWCWLRKEGLIRASHESEANMRAVEAAERRYAEHKKEQG